MEAVVCCLSNIINIAKFELFVQNLPFTQTLLCCTHGGCKSQVCVTFSVAWNGEYGTRNGANLEVPALKTTKKE